MTDKIPGKFFTIRNKANSFRFAIRGLRHAIATQHNLWIQIPAAAVAIALGFILSAEPWEWCVILLCIGLVFSLEMINSAIEELTDRIFPELNEKAGRIKDMAAGAVLVSAIMAGIAGLLIFIPKIFM